MADPAFAELIGGLTEAFGQKMGSSRQTDEGILLVTTDGYLYAFIEDPNRLSLATVERFIAESPGGPRHLVLFCRGHLPLAFTSALQKAGSSVVEGGRFAELARSLGLESFLGEEPRAEAGGSTRLLPSAHLLDTLMTRGRTWLEWGIPALSLRFYRQAAELKPEFLPARNGIATSLLALGLVGEARTAYAEIRSIDPGNLDARIGEAAVLGAEGHPDQEIAAYRALLHEDPKRLGVRAHLVAALVDHHHWEAARTEIAHMLDQVPEDPYLRFLHSVALERTGATKAAAEERGRARQLGLTAARERLLCEQLGLPAPSIPEGPSPVPPEVVTPPIETAAIRAPEAPASRPSETTPPAARPSKAAARAPKKGGRRRPAPPSARRGRKAK